MNKHHLLSLGIIAALGTAAAVLTVYRPPTVNNLDSFAACLAQKNITMYGADWCPHCQNEKRAFGDSFRLVPYVECPQNTDLCIKLGIEGYPTWIFPDGRRFRGEQGLEKLSAESGCPLKN